MQEYAHDSIGDAFLLEIRGNKPQLTTIFNPTLKATENGLDHPPSRSTEMAYSGVGWIFKDMFREVCKKYPFNRDHTCILNPSDFPLLPTDRLNPWYGVDKAPLLQDIPILSLSSTNEHDDLLLPTYEDWIVIRESQAGIFHRELKWDSKIPTVMFRGSGTGLGGSLRED